MEKFKAIILNKSYQLIFYQLIALVYVMKEIWKGFPFWLSIVTIFMIAAVSSLSIYFKTWGK